MYIVYGLGFQKVLILVKTYYLLYEICALLFALLIRPCSETEFFFRGEEGASALTFKNVAVNLQQKIVFLYHFTYFLQGLWCYDLYDSDE